MLGGSSSSGFYQNFPFTFLLRKDYTETTRQMSLEGGFAWDVVVVP